jgi:hypothetical protein
MPTPESIAEAFRQLDFHDDTFVDLKVLPAQRREEAVRSIVEIQLRQYSENTLRVIRFTGCTNLRVAIDFDVLVGNLPPNTSSVAADTDLNRIRHLMESQKKDWGVDYVGTAVSPLTQKLAALDELVFFRVKFCGGAVDVIAREYEVESADKPMQPTPR